MQTFIEQKNDLNRQIVDLERRNQQLYDEIDRNELEIAKLKKILANVGTQSEQFSVSQRLSE